MVFHRVATSHLRRQNKEKNSGLVPAGGGEGDGGWVGGFLGGGRLGRVGRGQVGWGPPALPFPPSSES